MAENLEQQLGYTFRNPELLKLALTHSSWGHEKNKTLPHNERLEFLGDSVLELVSSEYLFHAYQDHPEGKLTKIRSHLVNRNALEEIARQLDLGNELLMGEAEAANGGRERSSNLENAMEAIIGAIFLDAGFDAARKILIPFLQPRLHRLTDNPEPHNSKGLLQEKLHARGETVSYRIVAEQGPAHLREFHATVAIGDVVYGTGVGRTKKDAETKAAAAALVKLGFV